MTTTLERQRRLRELHRALAADARADVDLAVKVGVLVALGYPRAHVARTLDLSAKDVALPLQRLERVAKSLDRDDEL
jgi:hypothetical protein